MLLSGRRQLSGSKHGIKIEDIVIEEVVSTRCLGGPIRKVILQSCWL